MKDGSKLTGFVAILSFIPTVVIIILTTLFLSSSLWIMAWPIALFFPFLFWLRFFDKYEPNVYIISEDELEISVLGLFKIRKKIADTKDWIGNMSVDTEEKIREEGRKYWYRLWRKFREGY